MKRSLIGFGVVISVVSMVGGDWVSLPDDPYFSPFQALKAPDDSSVTLKKGDRLAICGDSITEQKRYSRIMETYLTVCAPELQVKVRQFGWSGERAPGFLRRMTNDVLRFHPTIATTCYGMNDHRYQPYTEEIGREYRESSEAILQSFEDHDVRVLQGAAGTVGKMPHWVQSARGTVTDLNLGLLELRNIDVRLAREEEGVDFADVYLPMLVGGFKARRQWGEEYMVSGKDGVHPGWAGHLIMAYVFLKEMELPGQIGTVTIDLDTGGAEATSGHEILSTKPGEVELESARYPFCATGPVDDDNSIRSGMALVPFNEDLNRFILRVRHTSAPRYRVVWGETTKEYSAEQLNEGINLAADFEVNPFSEAFRRVDEAVARKQAYETRQIKELFHGPEGRADAELTALLTERARAPLVEAVSGAFKPVRHVVRIEPTPANDSRR